MTPIRLAAAFVLSLVAFPVCAEDIVLDQSAESCGNEYSDGRVTLSEGVISFYESSCEITAETATAEGARDLSLACSGEGEEWSHSLRIEETATGYRMTSDAGSTDYVRCN